VPLGDKAHVTAGVRYTDDKRSLDAGRQNFSSAGVASPQVFATNSGLSESWSKVSGRLSLDYQFTNDIMGYVAYNRGFKSGLFNTIIAPSFAPASVANPIPTPAAPLIDPPVKPEDIDAITAGFKSEFLDHKLRLNVEAFHYKYKNLQLQQVFIIPGGGTATQLTNAAKATIKGIDLDVTIQPVKNLSLTAAVELLDGKYDDYPDGQFFVYNPVTGGNCAFAVPNAAGVKNPTGCLATPPNYDPATGHWNLKGNHTIQSPPFSFTLTGTYDIPLSSGKLSLAASFSHSGNYYADADNGLGQIAPSSQLNDKQLLLDIVNGSVTWYATNEKYSVRLWGKNLTDQRYWSFANETGTITKNVPAPPRTFGVTFMTHF
jgi:iron complex outermembrane receptor protein